MRKTCIQRLSLALLLAAASCLNIPSTTIDSLTSSFDNAIAKLSGSSTQWQMTLNQLEKDLVKQGQDTIANQVQSLINRGIAAAAVEAKCGVDFLKTRLKEELHALLAKAKGQKMPKLEPHFCSVDPSAIDLRLSPNQRPATLNVYGFNLTVHNVTVKVVHKNGKKTDPAGGFFSVPNEYVATFNLVNYPFKPDDTQLSFKLTSGGEKTVGIDQAASCGGVGQSCCKTGRACDPGSGCEDSKCKTCPAPFVAVPQTLLKLSDEFDGNNCGGINSVHHYGGACDHGYHHLQCETAVIKASSDTSCNFETWSSDSKSDCACDVRFITPADCFKGIHCRVTITEQQDAPSRPQGCP